MAKVTAREAKMLRYVQSGTNDGWFRPPGVGYKTLDSVYHKGWLAVVDKKRVLTPAGRAALEEATK